MLRVYLIVRAENTFEQWQTLFTLFKTKPLASDIQNCATAAQNYITHNKRSLNATFLSQLSLVGFELENIDLILNTLNVQATLRGITGTTQDKLVGVLAAEIQESATELTYGTFTTTLIGYGTRTEAVQQAQIHRWGTIYPMLGREAFSESDLISEDQLFWYNRLINQNITQLSTYPLFLAGHIEHIGETLLFVVTPMLAAFRVTGSLLILDMIDILMEAAYSSLEDADGDGYLEWVWRELLPESLYLKDNHMATSGISALINQMAYCYQLNAGKTSPSGVNYAQREDKWKTFITNHFYPDTGFPADNLRHRTLAGMRGMYYHWKWSNDPASYDSYALFKSYYELEYSVLPGGEIANGLQVYNGRYIWDHGTPYPYILVGSYGWQPINYAQYTVGSAIDLALEGEIDNATMSLYAKSSEWMFNNGNLRKNMYVDELDNSSVTRILTWALAGANRWGNFFGPFDVNGLLGVTVNGILPAWMVVAYEAL